MNITKLSSKGQVIIPKPVRSAHHWEAGQELVVIDAGDGVLLKPKTPFSETHIDVVASCLNYVGTAKTLDEMNEAIKQGVMEHNNGID
ncbi:MAG: AbrB/MazE/SpoVT family DNA-binding domain-containing protein [Candidatus Marinimicrobia bacterium]|nr:AbrB/MazE/SpoVT family DNA-binding domain-containing protein [Candidatus Neomarinimicrobiota bacterium]MCH8068349.1 AbrB/MazE/SpoVT family DNA-binding domain-containing protein [Candidatus Neomarinimicrobiota bacterium]